MIVLRPPVAHETVDGLTRLARDAGTSLFSVDAERLRPAAAPQHRSARLRHRHARRRPDRPGHRAPGGVLAQHRVRTVPDRPGGAGPRPRAPHRWCGGRCSAAPVGAVRRRGPGGTAGAGEQPAPTVQRVLLRARRGSAGVRDGRDPDRAGGRGLPRRPVRPQRDVRASGCNRPRSRSSSATRCSSRRPRRRLGERSCGCWTGSAPTRTDRCSAVPLLGRAERSAVLDLLNGRNGG